MDNNVTFLAAPKEDLLDILLGEHIPSGNISKSSLPTKEMKLGLLGLGYPEFPSVFNPADLEPPRLVVASDEAVMDTLSWLKAFAGEAFPLSQYVRFTSQQDWATFSEVTRPRPARKKRPDRWACIAVGESLSQADGAPELASMALSRLASCFTVAMGRTSLLFATDEATQVCASRLRTLGDDPRFGRRVVPVDVLQTAWALASADISGSLDANTAAKLVVEAVLRQTATPGAGQIEPKDLKDFSILESDSIEERVMAFNRLTQTFISLAPENRGISFGVLFAAAAYMVGRSTSHLFLLQRVSKYFPDSLVWFGVIAGLAGPRTWDAAWLRAAKGAERLLKPDFSWLDVSTADICWVEFAWLAGAFDSVDPLLALPKMLPRTLGVEVVPGVTLQLRLGPAESEPSLTAARGTTETVARIRQLEETLAQIVNLANQSRSASEHRTSSPGSQQALDLGQEPPAPSSKSRLRIRRGS